MQTSIGVHYTAKVRHTFDVGRRFSAFFPTENGWLVSFFNEPDVLFLDHAFEVIRHLPFERRDSKHAGMSVSADRSGTFISIASRNEIAVYDSLGKPIWRRSHAPWDSNQGSTCLFGQDKHLWTVLPGEKCGVLDDLTVFHVETGERLARAPLPSDCSYFYLRQEPIQKTVLIAVACGQDGIFLHRACLADGVLDVADYGLSEALIHPNQKIFTGEGQTFLTGSQYGDTLCVRQLETGEVIREFAAENIFADDVVPGEAVDAFEGAPFYLGNRVIVAQTQFGRILLLDENGVLGTIWPEGSQLQGYDAQGKPTGSDKAVDFNTGLTLESADERGRLLVFEYPNRALLLDQFCQHSVPS